MRDGPRCFPPDSSCPAVLRCRLARGRAFRVRGSHALRPGVPPGSATRSRPLLDGPTTPAARRHAPGLGSSAFARRYSRNHYYFLFLRVLRCFSSPRWLRHCRCRVAPAGSPIRTSADLFAFADPRGFSQLVTSFFASGSLRHPPCALLRFPYAFFSAPAPLPGSRSPLSVALRFSFTLVSFSFLSRVHHVNGLLGSLRQS